VTVQAQLSGPHGDLRADRIEVSWRRRRTHRSPRAYTNVSLKLDTRTATATGSRTSRRLGDLMSGAGTKAVKVVERPRDDRQDVDLLQVDRPGSS